jgi:hypothetical protein
VVRLWVVMLLGLLVALGAREAGTQAGQAASVAVETQEDPHPNLLPKGEGVRFEAIDIFVDSGAMPLAAYQVEVRAVAGDVKLVGVEGGDHAAYKDPPRYDPKALHDGQFKERIIVAAFSTGAELPSGRVRVARLHVQVSGAEGPEYVVKLMAAGAADGHRIDAIVTHGPAAGPGDTR